jgi:hypothetical protein
VKGHVQRRGKTYRYFLDGDADPLTGKRRQVAKGGFATTVTPLSRGVTAATETTNPTTGGPRP